MKLKSFTLFVLALVLGIFFVPGYSSSPLVTTTPKEPVRFVVLEGGGFKWYVVLPAVNYLTDTPSGAVIKIWNELDCNIVVDFEALHAIRFPLSIKKNAK